MIKMLSRLMFVAALAAPSMVFSQTGSRDFSLVLKANQTYFDCLQKQASLIDDGISDAQTIAKLIAPECEVQSLVYAQAAADFDPSAKFSEVFAAVRKKSFDDATKQVLAYRRSKANRGAE